MKLYIELRRRILNRLKRCWYCHTKILSYELNEEGFITQESNGGAAHIRGVGGAYVCISCLLKKREQGIKNTNLSVY